jgi:hypothetical protein
MRKNLLIGKLFFIVFLKTAGREDFLIIRLQISERARRPPIGGECR